MSSSIFGKKEREYSRIVQKSTDKLIQSLFDKQGIPETGWSEHQLELFINWIASHDSNNRLDVQNVGAGEREGRVACPLVRRLNCNLSHGIGRSGNLTEVQPKALGSSMLGGLANEFAHQSLRVLGLSCCKAALVVPLCTGMSLSLCMTSFRQQRPSSRFVIWFRVDQKSCLKSIIHAGFEPIVISPERIGDALVTNVEHLNTALEKGADQIACVLTTTSCFAPRSPDSLEEIAALCQHYGVPHLVNNAYGLQSDECIRRLNAGQAAGRIDAFVQSLDKNFQVPVGGAIIAVCKKSALNHIAECYPGRASSVPARDFVLTLLHLGIDGLTKSYEQQKRLFHKMKSRLRHFAEEIGEFVYDVDDNQISLAMTLSSIPQEQQSLFGAVLFSRGITGARVVTSTAEVKRIAGLDYDFKNFGSHTSEQHGGYLNIACGVGMSEEEMDELFSRLSAAYARFTRQIEHKHEHFRPGRHENADDSDEED